jgi:hypothetical protein
MRETVVTETPAAFATSFNPGVRSCAIELVNRFSKPLYSAFPTKEKLSRASAKVSPIDPRKNLAFSDFVGTESEQPRAPPAKSCPYCKVVAVTIDDDPGDDIADRFDTMVGKSAADRCKAAAAQRVSEAALEPPTARTSVAPQESKRLPQPGVQLAVRAG